MDNHMDNNPNGNGPDNKGPGKIISRSLPFWCAF